MRFFYRRTDKETGQAQLRCVNWGYSLERSRKHLAELNADQNIIRNRWFREEVPLACVKRLFPNAAWVDGYSRPWPTPNNPASF